MGGRYEKEQKIDVKIKEKLGNLPSVVTDYYYSLIGSGKSYRTAKVYIEGLEWFIQFLYSGKCPEEFYKEINSSHINRYIASIRTKTVNGVTSKTSDSFRAGQWSALNSFFNFLVPEYVTINPMASTQRPKNKDNPKVTYLTQEEISLLLKNVENKASKKVKNRDLCILKMGFSTGLRISAILQIDIDDIDWENHQIKVTEKGDYDNYVMMGATLEAQIKAWLSDRKKYFGNVNSNALFVTQMNSRMHSNTAEVMIRDYAKDVTDKKVTPHVMRHSCATNLYEKTGDIYLCANQLNHKDISSTQKYAEFFRTGESQQKATALLDDLVSPARVLYGDIILMPIEDLDLSLRTYNCLKREHVNVLGDLMSNNFNRIKKIRNLSLQTLEEVAKKVDDLDLGIRWKVTIGGEIWCRI